GGAAGAAARRQHPAPLGDGPRGVPLALEDAGQRPLVVRAAPVAVQDVVYEIKAIGSLEPEELVQVTAEVQGAVSEVRFNEGDRVGRDTVLARIDPERYRLEAERAEAGYRKALADAESARSILARREALARDQLVAAEELNRSRAESDQLIAEAAAAKAARDIANQNVERANVRPSRSGTINTRAVQTGQFVQPGNVLATLVDTSRLRLRFKVGDAESLRARRQQTVKFRVASLGSREFEATVYHVSDVADPGTRQVEVMAWVRNPGELKPGFFTEVTLASETRKGALVVPEGAIQASDKGFVTYVVAAQKAQLRPVAIGLRTGTGVVEILSGLKAGEVVVTEGSDRLADGVAVQVAQGAASAPASPGTGEAQ
ncbi:MAG TPA: efflux RND transporter periplasmic adaptor subunit, partial [Vicinamibacteria bacterium]|nr:efflux RND transporter periplasmic adaptor subunit [Vicinamibacteria bacterium]